MTPDCSSRRSLERGAVAILTAFLALALFGIAAFVVDLGQARDTRGRSQHASDASALAGANVLYPAGTCQSPVNGPRPCLTDAVTAVKTYASRNFSVTDADWAACTDPVVASGRPATYSSVAGTPICISFDSLTAPEHVRVVMPKRKTNAAFGPATKAVTSGVGSAAESLVTKGTSCALCFLGDVSTNNTDFTVTGGSIAVKGSISAGPSSDWTANSIGVTGTTSGGTFTPPATPIPTFPDPYASMTLPLATSAYTNTARSDPCTDGPGVYGAVDLPNSACELSTGIYVITGSWGMKNSTVLTNSFGGVTLYLKSTGSLDFKNGNVALSPRTTGATAGFVLLSDRDNTNAIELQGNGGTQLTGKIYAANAGLSFNGGSCFGFSGGPVVVNGSSSVGNSCMNVSNATDIAVSPGKVNLSQ